MSQIHDYENEGGNVEHEGCPMLMFSYRDTVIYCCRPEGHKGDHVIAPEDKDKMHKATAEFMRKAVKGDKGNV